MSNTNILNNLPSKEILIMLIEAIQGNRYDCDNGMVDITVASDGTNPYDWNFQTGDDSYSGTCFAPCYFYKHWAIGSIDDQTCPNTLAIDLLDQLEELLAYDDLMMEC